MPPVEEGLYWIQNQHSGKALEVEGWGTNDGDNVQQWEYLGNANQQWYVRLYAEGTAQHIFENKHSGKVLLVEDWGTGNGDNVVQWEKTGGANQKWYPHHVIWCSDDLLRGSV